MTSDFVGTKIALLFENKILVYLRDDKPGLRFANMWDLPGGGREGSETPFECVAREVMEEFGITLKKESVFWEKEFPSMTDEKLRAFFMVGRIDQADIDIINFGQEGQKWDVIEVDSFLKRDDVVPHLKDRYMTYLESIKGK